MCAAHLTDDGIVVDKDTVTVEWQGTGPSEDNQNTLFVCSLDSGPFNLCELTFIQLLAMIIFIGMCVLFYE